MNMLVEAKINSSKKFPPVSIIIPAYNEQNHINKCLESILELDYPCFETIVVDDGSTDGTSAIVNDFYGILSNLILIRLKKNHGRSHARNQGTKQARYEILVFLDADCIVSRKWLKALVRKMMKTGNCAMGRIKTANSGISRWVDEESKRFNDFWQKEYHKAINRGFCKNLDGIFGIPRVLFDEIGEFDETLPYREDGDYFKRLTDQGIKVAFAPSAIVFHHHPKALRSYFTKGVNVAKATYLLNQKHGDPLRDTFKKRFHESLFSIISVLLLIIFVLTKIYFPQSQINSFIILFLLFLLFLSFRSVLLLLLKVLFGKLSVSGAVLTFVQHQGERWGYLTSFIFRKKWESIVTNVNDKAV